MRYSSRLTYTSILIILCHLAVGQTKLKGTFINSEKVGQITATEVLKFSGDSIWLSRTMTGNNVVPGEKFQNWAGTFKYQKTGYNNGPFYHGFMYVMSCDTCPQFWQYTTNRRDSLNLETFVWTTGDTDTIVSNGRTSYMTFEFMDTESPTDINRIRELIFTLTRDGNILMHRKIYRRQRKPT